MLISQFNPLDQTGMGASGGFAPQMPGYPGSAACDRLGGSFGNPGSPNININMNFGTQNMGTVPSGGFAPSGFQPSTLPLTGLDSMGINPFGGAMPLGGVPSADNTQAELANNLMKLLLRLMQNQPTKKKKKKKKKGAKAIAMA